MTTLAIDLGTFDIRFAVFRDNVIKVLENEFGNTYTPNSVAFTDKELFFGEAAKYQLRFNATNSVFGLKRLIGRKFSDPQVQQSIKNVPFNVVEAKNGELIIELNAFYKKKQFSPVELLAMILSNVKATAEKSLSETLENAVITVPTYFSSAQRQATKDAATVAGFNNVRLINETTAAAVYYGFENRKSKTETALFYHLGSGCFNVSIIDITDGSHFKVLAANGDCNLGGIELENCLVEYFTADFERRHNVKISDNQRTLQRLRVACEGVRRNLSTKTSTFVRVNNLHDNITLLSEIPRSKLEELCKSHFEKTFANVRQTLVEASLSEFDIDKVILVGCSAQTPYVKNWATKFFGSEKIESTLNVDQTVVNGAAIYASQRPIKIDETFAMPVTLFIDEIHSEVMKKDERLPYTVELKPEQLAQQKIIICEDNKFYNYFQLSKNLPAETGIQISLTRDLDGILQLCAKIPIKLKSFSDTTDDDMQRMIKNGKFYKNIDIENKKRREARIELENYVLAFQNDLASNSLPSEMPPHKKEFLRNYCATELQWLKKNQNEHANVYKKRFDDLKIRIKEELPEYKMEHVEMAKKKLQDYIAKCREDCKTGAHTAESILKFDKHCEKHLEWLERTTTDEVDVYEKRLADVKEKFFKLIFKEARLAEEAKVRLHTYLNGLEQNDIVKKRFEVEMEWIKSHPNENADVYEERLKILHSQFERFEKQQKQTDINLAVAMLRDYIGRQRNLCQSSNWCGISENGKTILLKSYESTLKWLEKNPNGTQEIFTNRLSALKRQLDDLAVQKQMQELLN